MSPADEATGLRSVLRLPAAYRFFHRLVGGDYRAVYVNSYVRPKEGDRVLDVGCGTGEVLAYLPRVSYVGVDISPEYVAAARRRFGGRGEFRCGRAGDLTVAEPGTYDLVMANGLLHHLADDEALALFRLAHSALKPAGRLVTFDGCFVDGQSAVARFLLRRDRGRFVRRRDEYLALAARVFPHVTAAVRHDLIRLPYTHIILECSPRAAVAAA
jgi:SAM-dependent methyltransferase